MPATTSARQTAPPSSPAAQTFLVSLLLKGGGNTSTLACGATHHYRTYASATPVAFSGTVHPIPSGHWKVKLKIKVCAGADFRDFAKIEALRDKHRGTFSGSFSAPPAGEYSVRAALYVNGSLSAESDKLHFATH